MTIDEMRKFLSDPVHSRNLSLSPNAPDDDLDFAIDYYAGISHGRYGTTKVKGPHGDISYYYKGFEIERDTGTSAGFYGAWKSRPAWAGSFKDVVREIDAKLAK